MDILVSSHPGHFCGWVSLGRAGGGGAHSSASSPAGPGFAGCHCPGGAVQQAKLGNGLWEWSQFNPRLQPELIRLGTSAGGSERMEIGLNYSDTFNNGNILGQTVKAPKDAGGTLTLSQTYAYDGVNRIATASEAGSWSRAYGYDLFGNRRVTGSSVFVQHPQDAADFDAATNRLNASFGGGYDAAGNLTEYDEPASTLLDFSIAYDAENKQTAYCKTLLPCSGANVKASYHYDGAGNRVRKIEGADTSVYVYDAFGKLAAEYSTAAPSNPGTEYRTTDHLGSTRLVTGSTGAAVAYRDFFPFGEEIPATYGGRSAIAAYNDPDPFRQKFTGKERDDESDLDYFLARYYSAPFGRFLSVDPARESGTSSDPQSWNRYRYVRNNPLSLVDPDGRQEQMAEVVSIGSGLESLKRNLDRRRYGAALVDAFGLAFDGLAAATPFVPGVMGLGIRVIRGADDLLPRGFSSVDRFKEFSGNLLHGLKKAGFDDAQGFFQGSAATGKSFDTGEAFDVGRTSDFDIAITGGKLFDKARELGIPLRSKGTRTGELSESQLKKLGLAGLQKQLSEQAGREVNFMIFKSADDALKRIPESIEAAR